MHLTARSRKRPLFIGLLALLLAACGPAPVTDPTTQGAAPTAAGPATARPATAPQPVTAPTVAPAPTSAPKPSSSPAPTSAPSTPEPQPQATALLPAPLYFVAGDGQIWRIERDGTTRRQITYESSRVSDIDIAKTDNALAYVIGEGDDQRIVRLDESGRREILSGPVASPRLSPDGERMAFQLYRPVDGMQLGRDRGSDTGIYIQERSGGRPGLLQASDPITDTNSPPPDARQFYPIAWSPDGAQLLVGAYFPVGEGGFQAVRSLNDGALVEIKDAFGEASWSPDGTSIVMAGGTITQDALLGLWRVDPRTGQATSLLAPTDDATAVLATRARQYADGTVYVFLSQTNSPEVDAVNLVTPYRVAPGGSLEPLRAESYRIVDAAWAEDASGAAIVETTDPQVLANGPLGWLPAGGGAAVSLGATGSQPRWGNEQPQPRPDACDLFSPLTWEPPAGRRQLAEVLDVQRRLVALGYAEVGAPDGYFGDRTREAVQAFQRANGLPAGGDVDCSTWALLLAGKGARA